MRATHEHEFEAQLGLPEKLPQGEYILWQGSPEWIGLGIEAFHLRALGLYFMLMFLLQLSYLSGQVGELNWTPLFITSSLIVLTLTSLSCWAWMSAKASLYTITNKRVVMRIGVVFSITYNLPLRQILSAHELHRKSELSDISLTLRGEDRIAWLHLWPHSRPWVINKPEPTLRCIKDGLKCAEILKSAWIEMNSDCLVIPEEHQTLHQQTQTRPTSSSMDSILSAS
jgi:hypothetical protein